VRICTVNDRFPPGSVIAAILAGAPNRTFRHLTFNVRLRKRQQSVRTATTGAWLPNYQCPQKVKSGLLRSKGFAN
jgi:hypothetical protein